MGYAHQKMEGWPCNFEGWPFSSQTPWKYILNWKRILYGWKRWGYGTSSNNTANPEQRTGLAVLLDFVSNEWNHAGKMLENSCTLIFFGFAFNQYDLKILALLKDTEEWMKKIILINRNPRVIRQASTIWPSAKITFIHSDDLDQDILTLRDELRNPSVPYWCIQTTGICSRDCRSGEDTIPISSFPIYGLSYRAGLWN